LEDFEKAFEGVFGWLFLCLLKQKIGHSGNVGNMIVERYDFLNMILSFSWVSVLKLIFPLKDVLGSRMELMFLLIEESM